MASAGGMAESKGLLTMLAGMSSQNQGSFVIPSKVILLFGFRTKIFLISFRIAGFGPAGKEYLQARILSYNKSFVGSSKGKLPYAITYSVIHQLQQSPNSDWNSSPLLSSGAA